MAQQAHALRDHLGSVRRTHARTHAQGEMSATVLRYPGEWAALVPRVRARILRAARAAGVELPAEQARAAGGVRACAGGGAVRAAASKQAACCCWCLCRSTQLCAHCLALYGCTLWHRPPLQVEIGVSWNYNAITPGEVDVEEGPGVEAADGKLKGRRSLMQEEDSDRQSTIRVLRLMCVPWPWEGGQQQVAITSLPACPVTAGAPLATPHDLHAHPALPCAPASCPPAAAAPRKRARRQPPRTRTGRRCRRLRQPSARRVRPRAARPSWRPPWMCARCAASLRAWTSWASAREWPALI